jgi:preprotein translocase subunit SecB
MAEANTNPVFQIQRVYLKDLSLEQPNSPQILLEQQQPQVDINLALSAEGVGEGVYEVCVTGTVTTKVGERTLFLVEAKQAGIFQVRNLPKESLDLVLSITCPNILFPYARETISDSITRSGFPPFLLAPVNFEALYQQRMQQQQAAEPATTTH